MRILLFLLTNLAVVIVVGTVWRLLGFDSFLAANGVLVLVIELPTPLPDD